MAGPATLYQAGVHGSRPANGSGCVLYSCTTHNLVYRDDGSSWTTFMTLVGGSGGDIATDTLWDAKGDLAAGTGANAAAKVTVGANDTILMADSAQSTGLKWVASQTPSTQAFSDAAAEGTADTYARGDHKHAMPASPGGMTLLTDTLLGGDTATFDFTSISGSYKHLRLEVSARGTDTSTNTWVKINFNNDTGSNYDGIQTQLFSGFSSSAFNEDLGATSFPHGFYMPAASSQTGDACSCTITIPDYASTTFNKSFHAEGYLRLTTGSGNVRFVPSGGNWRSTAAITRVTLTPTTGNFKSGSRASLYGIS